MAGGRSLAVDDLTSGTKYAFRVRACGNGTPGPWSGSVQQNGALTSPSVRKLQTTRSAIVESSSEETASSGREAPISFLGFVM